jgi:hypothetical protein
VPAEGERIAVVEALIGELRGDVQAMTLEQERTRKRLHSLEATTQGVVKAAQAREALQAEQLARQMRWIQILTLIVAAAGVIGPLVYSGAAH